MRAPHDRRAARRPGGSRAAEREGQHQPAEDQGRCHEPDEEHEAEPDLGAPTVALQHGEHQRDEERKDDQQDEVARHGYFRPTATS
jgi:hypothetical protein